ncbi:MAG: hypothetical protein LBG48_06075 [Rickettsiales bacterium]|jgi:hypothetical protein|nr:hypothetical protein [Rickettsiales bacterium]
MDLSNLLEQNLEAYRDFYLLTNILYFSCFVKNLPILKNEKINRLQYCFDILQDKLSVNRLRIENVNYKDYVNIIDSYFYTPNRTDNQKKIVAFLILLTIYKRVLRFYSKKYFWQKNVKTKINDLVGACVEEVGFFLTKKSNFENIYECFSSIEDILSGSNYLKYIEERQQLKKYNNYFNEYEKTEDIVFLSKKEDILKILEKERRGITKDFIKGFICFFGEKINLFY